MKGLILLLLLVSTNAFTKGLKGYCFKSSINLNAVQNHLKTIELPADQLSLRKSLNCIEVNVGEARDDLYQKFILTSFRINSIYSGGSISSTTQSAVKNCRLEIIKKAKKNLKGTRVEVSRKGVISSYESTGSGSTKSTILLGAGLQGQMRVDNELIFVKCNPRARGNYDLTFLLESQANSEKGGSSLSSTVSVTKGVSVDVGSLVRDLRRRVNEVGLPSGVKIRNEKGQERFDYSVKIIN